MLSLLHLKKSVTHHHAPSSQKQVTQNAGAKHARGVIDAHPLRGKLAQALEGTQPQQVASQCLQNRLISKTARPWSAI